MFGDWLVCQTEISARPVLLQHVSSGAATPTIGIIGIKSTHKVHLRHLICVPQEVTLSHWHTLIFVVCAYNSNHILTLCNETFLWQWWWFTWRYNDNDSNDDDEDEDDDERNPVSQSGVGSCDQIMCSSCVQQIISTLAAHSRGFTSEDFFWITWWLFLDFLVIFFGFLTEPQASALSNHCILALVTWPERPKGKKDKVQHFSVRFSIFPEHFGFLGKCWVFGERKNWIFGEKTDFLWIIWISCWNVLEFFWISSRIFCLLPRLFGFLPDLFWIFSNFSWIFSWFLWEISDFFLKNIWICWKILNFCMGHKNFIT